MCCGHLCANFALLWIVRTGTSSTSHRPSAAHIFVSAKKTKIEKKKKQNEKWPALRISIASRPKVLGAGRVQDIVPLTVDRRISDG